ncbi:hypothetical protein Sjap_005393 [Stephania japonica]|uniref:Uncharacterized protein n=1 Tax=Stephania japonica TaxID=461633 RepID=A0AAP0K528_9MAGN
MKLRLPKRNIDDEVPAHCICLSKNFSLLSSRPVEEDCSILPEGLENNRPSQFFRHSFINKKSWNTPRGSKDHQSWIPFH